MGFTQDLKAEGESSASKVRTNFSKCHTYMYMYSLAMIRQPLELFKQQYVTDNIVKLLHCDTVNAVKLCIPYS